MAVKPTTSAQKFRVALVVTSLIAVPVMILAAHWSWSPALPDLLPIHWDAAGNPDGWIPSYPLFTLSLTMSVVAGALGVAAVLLPRVDLAGDRRPLAIAGSFAGGFAGLWGAPAWAAYADADVGWVLLILTGCIGFGTVPYLLMPRATMSRPATS